MSTTGRTTITQRSDHLQRTVKIENGAPTELMSRQASEGKKHLYIDGGVTIQRFLQTRLINEVTITQIPVLLGSGIPLFGSIGLEVSLSHLETTSSRNGLFKSGIG